VPADVAALKHACQYHIPPNDCRGASWRRRDPKRHRAELIRGCYDARRRFYAHRGLPLHCLEYYGLATFSVAGSLTPEIQDRQVASLLMGAPICFSGDLRSLNDAQLDHYRRRFDLLGRLQRQYDIYRNFQFSGVPGPTDTDWHWWGKLDPDGHGAVVVLRGLAGADSRAINVPWVERDRSYQLKASFAEKDLGIISGALLEDEGVRLTLPPLGQEIVELAPASENHSSKPAKH
jgi:hypothetical protein